MSSRKTCAILNPPKVGDILVKRFVDDGGQVVYGVIETCLYISMPYLWVWQLHIRGDGSVVSFYPRTTLWVPDEGAPDQLYVQHDDRRLWTEVSWVEDETSIDAGKDKADDSPGF